MLEGNSTGIEFRAKETFEKCGMIQANAVQGNSGAG